MVSTMRVERVRRNFADESNRYDVKRDRLVMCARRLGEEGNAAKVSVTDVTSEMGITRGLFYYYFGGKDEMNRSIADTYVRDLLDGISMGVEACETREDAVAAIVEAAYAWVYDEEGAERPMLHVLDEIGLACYVWTQAATDVAKAFVDWGLLTDYGKLGDDALFERARFVVTGILGEARLNPTANHELVADSACSALRYRKRRQPA